MQEEMPLSCILPRVAGAFMTASPVCSLFPKPFSCITLRVPREDSSAIFPSYPCTPCVFSIIFNFLVRYSVRSLCVPKCYTVFSLRVPIFPCDTRMLPVACVPCAFARVSLCIPRCISSCIPCKFLADYSMPFAVISARLRFILYSPSICCALHLGFLACSLL